MAQSLIAKTELVVRDITRGTNTALAGGKISLEIDRSSLLAEMALKFVVSATCTVAPTSFDVRQFVERLTLKNSDGDVIAGLSGQQCYDLARLTEDDAAAVTVAAIGASSARYTMELHSEMDGAYHDLATAVRGSDHSKFTLEIEVCSEAKAAGIGFAGATITANTLSMTVTVEAYTYPAMVNSEEVATDTHYSVAKEYSGTTSGRKSIQLDPSNLTRFITLHVDNIAGGVNAAAPSDSLVSNVILRQGSEILREVTFESMRFATQKKRGKNITGFGVLDWGDFEGGFCRLNDSPVYLDFDVTAATACRVQVAQDYMRARRVG